MTLKLDKDNPLATKVQTSAGAKARLLCVDFSGARPLVAAVQYPGVDDEHLESFYSDGSYYCTGESMNDLINAPVEHRRWVNWYQGDGVLYTGVAHQTKAGADDECAPPRIACVEVVFKEGDGLT